MEKVLHGTIHGHTIELEGDPQIASGSRVAIVVRSTEAPPANGDLAPRRSAAGMMAAHWTEEDDRILAEIEQDRRRDTRREPPE